MKEKIYFEITLTKFPEYVPRNELDRYCIVVRDNGDFQSYRDYKRCFEVSWKILNDMAAPYWDAVVGDHIDDFFIEKLKLPWAEMCALARAGDEIETPFVAVIEAFDGKITGQGLVGPAVIPDAEARNAVDH